MKKGPTWGLQPFMRRITFSELLDQTAIWQRWPVQRRNLFWPPPEHDFVRRHFERFRWRIVADLLRLCDLDGRKRSLKERRKWRQDHFRQRLYLIQLRQSPRTMATSPMKAPPNNSAASDVTETEKALTDINRIASSQELISIWPRHVFIVDNI